MKNILILEDNDDRIELFRKNLVGHSTIITQDVEYMKTLLSGAKWDVLFLDHDLGGEGYVDSGREDTGAEIARWLDENPDHKPDHIILHSLNENGSKYMKSLLPESVWVPNIWMQDLSKLLNNVLYLASIPVAASKQSTMLEQYGRFN